MLIPIAAFVASTLLAAPPPASEPVSVGATSAKMLAALETVSVDAIKKDVYFIASDNLEGRDTPSEGLRVAARFLRSRLERLEWKPGAPDGYFYTYPLDQKRLLDENASKIEWQGKGGSGTLRFGVDYFLPSMSDLVEVETSANIVYAGDGSKDDINNAHVAGKWAFVFDAGEADVSSVSRYARRAKAKGLIVAPGPGYKGEEYEKRFARTLERLRSGSVSYPKPEKKGGKGAAKEKEEEPADEDGGSSSRGPFPSVLLTRAATASLVGAAKNPSKLALGGPLGLELTETRKLSAEGGQIQVENVCGFWPGSDPELAKECIILSAHYDHVGVMRGQIHNGADDNGSGTCLMMAVAEALKNYGPLRRSVMIIWVSGEEKGLWGSKAFSENPWFPEGVRPIANINIDMVGRNGPEKLLVTPTKERAKDYNGLTKLADELAPLEGFPKLGSADQYYERSDHAMFAKLGIPVMFLFSDVHEDYHQPGDDPEKLDYDKVHRVARLVLRILDRMQGDKLDLK